MCCYVVTRVRVCYAGRDADSVEKAAANAVRASSEVIAEVGNLVARNAVDNHVTSALWTNEERSPWWAVDLGQNYRINVVTVIVPTDRLTQRTPSY